MAYDSAKDTSGSTQNLATAPLTNMHMDRFPGIPFVEQGDAQGMYQLDVETAGRVSGYMTHIPLEWQSAFGGRRSPCPIQSTLPNITN